MKKLRIITICLLSLAASSLCALEFDQGTPRPDPEKTKIEGDAYRAKNKLRQGVRELPNGLQYEILRAAKGAQPKRNDKVTVHYHGTLVDGRIFDSTVKRGYPATFPIAGVIKGWQLILPMMTVGSKWRVVIPPELAYGARGAGKLIGPNSTLVFEIEIFSID